MQRARSTTSYGYHRDTTPFQDELATTGLRFATGYSPASWTVPSVGSLLTNSLPADNGLLYTFDPT